MAGYLRLTSVACALVLSGCNLGSLESIYNQTSCPIRVKYSLVHGWSSAGEVPTVVAPGNRLLQLVPHRDQEFDWIVVIDQNNVEHRYNAAMLTALRPSKDSNETWGYTDSGLVFLSDEPEQRDLDNLAEKPCGDLHQAQPAIS